MRATLLALALLAAPLAAAQTDTTAVAPVVDIGVEGVATERVEDAGSAEAPAPVPPVTTVYTAPKEVALGYVLGYFFPGGGHYYAGETGRGAMLTASAVAGYAFILSAALSTSDCGPFGTCTVSDAAVTQAVVGLGLLVGTSVYSIVDGGQAVRRANRANGFAEAPRATVAPGGAGLAMRVRL